MREYDLVIRGGDIVDGSGADVYRADVAIKGDRIMTVGIVEGTGSEEIDASGKIVTPGFVDVHTHYDGQVTWEHQLAPSSDHGITTVVMGNCGVGFAPVRSSDHQLVIKLMEGVEDIPEIVMSEGVPWNWETFPEYLAALDKREMDIDFATQIPHSPLRVYVMGERGANLEAATDDDLHRMRELTREAIECGALGVTTSRNLFHRFRSGKFAPSVNTAEDELLALAGGLKDAGSGVFQLNLNIDAEPEDEVKIITNLIRQSSRPLNFSLLDLRRRPENWGMFVDALGQAEKEGLPLRGHYPPRPIGLLFGLDLTLHPFSLNPSFRPLADLPLSEKVARMRDPELRARIIAEEPEDPNPVFVNMIRNATTLYVLSDPADYFPGAEDMLEAKAKRLGVPFRELIYDELLNDDGHAILVAANSDVHEYFDKTGDVLDRPNLIMGLGDGGAHYGSICDAIYTTYVLTHRLGKQGLTLPKAIKALTSDSAASVGLHDRGLIKPGYKADLNVIDINRLTLRRPSMEHTLPAGGKRLVQKAEGYEATIVSGAVTYRNGQATGALPGRLIRGAKPAPDDRIAVAAE